MKSDSNGALQVFYALGEHDALGVSPFGIDSVEPSENNHLRRSYAVLQQVAPMIFATSGSK